MSSRVTLALSTLGTALAAAWTVACRSPEPAPEPAPAPVHVTPTVARSKEEYFARGRADVERNARIQRDERTARNVVLFVGDGMGVTTITAARIRAGEKSGRHEAEELSFETFPHLAHSKTYQANQQVPDSAPTMTAMVTGCKTNDGMLSVAPEVQGLDFASALLPGNRLTTILESAEERGLWTGVVTTARVTHATPGACYAHTPARDYECDADLDNRRAFSEEAALRARDADFPDVARQLLEFAVHPTQMNGKPSPGLELVMGGGRSRFLHRERQDPEYPDRKGRRLDRDLVDAWKERGGTFVFERTAFDALDPATTGPVLALFEYDHMRFELDDPSEPGRARDPGREPSLAEMTEKALRILQGSPSGFFLMVEAGRIDHAHHAGNAAKALEETLALSDAVSRAVELVGDDTLVVVTADHSHVLTMSGYPTRENPILGLVRSNDGETGSPADSPALARDGKPYTTLGYMNGIGAVQAERPDLSQVDTQAPGFRQQALVPTEAETHGGEDVAIYARGPQAYLFQGTMEQNAIYWVMARALGLEEP